MSSDNKMQRHLTTLLKDRNFVPCLSSNNSEVFFIDDSKAHKKCIIFDSVVNEGEFVKIINPNKKIIFLLALDGCFFGEGKSPKRCDCIFFDDATFCFAELKLEALSNYEDTITKNREEAVRQLRTTIEFFNSRLKNDYLDFLKEAYVCTPPHYPQKNTALSETAIIFSDEFGVTFFEANEKTFQ